MNFVGVREYREGDALRDLHHKAFARYGKPFTKEFETERGAGAILVLDVTARNLREKSSVEMLIRLAAGIGLWLLERNALGRFFIGDDEIPLVHADGGESLLEALARIPAASLLKSLGGLASGNAQKRWSPAARPLGPVLRLGHFATDDPLVHKQVVLESHSMAVDELKSMVSDDVLAINAKFLERSFEKSRETEVSL
jgi:hypothetical protein